MKSQSQAYIYGIAAVLMWSTVATAFKIALRYLSPLQLVALASFNSTLVLTVILLVQGKLHLTWRYLRTRSRYYLLLGLLNPFGYYLILFKAYDLLPAQQAQPLNYTWAITLTLMAVPILGHKLHRYDIAAMVFGYLGAVVIATNGDLLTLHFQSPLGVILALLSTLFWSGYWIINRRRQDEPVAALLAGFLLSLPVTWISCLSFDGFPTVGWQGWASSAYVGLFEMGITFVCWIIALKKTEKTARISNLIFISPFLSLYFIAKLLGEPIAPATYIGLVLIIAGLIIQQYGARNASKHSPETQSTC